VQFSDRKVSGARQGGSEPLVVGGLGGTGSPTSLKNTVLGHMTNRGELEENGKKKKKLGLYSKSRGKMEKYRARRIVQRDLLIPEKKDSTRQKRKVGQGTLGR